RCLHSVGVVRIHPLTCPGAVRDVDVGVRATATTTGPSAIEEYRAIISTCVAAAGRRTTTTTTAAAAAVDGGARDDDGESERKRLTKEGVAMASSYLTRTLGLDVSVVDVEIVLSVESVLDTDGLLVCCFLDAGCARAVVRARGGGGDDVDVDAGLSAALGACDAARVPRERLVLHCKPGGMLSAIMRRIDEVETRVGTLSLQSASPPSLSAKLKCVVQLDPRDYASIDELAKAMSSLSSAIGENRGSITLVDPNAEQLGRCYAACIRTDREDGLYPTVVCTRSDEALGLVYSNKDSIVEALRCGRGVYYSRSRSGLWRKGDTSGHHQTLHRIDADCDADALRFTVTQNGDDVRAFCHLNTLTCWGEPRGLRHLEGTLARRLVDAPPGSYTKRLFDDRQLLRDKLVEEAQELSEADTREHVAEELADVIYFAMVRAAAAGVSIDDAVAVLDRRARKVTRRQGDSKAFRIKAGEEILGSRKLAP
ncbi:hypothetical protein ACHAW5_007531, partial [Stephanodiscus triporus]